MKALIGMRSIWLFEAYDSLRNLKWREEIPNIVVNVGLDDVLDKYFKGSTYTAAHYVGLKGVGSAAAGDTMTSHAGWAELTSYSEAVRQTLTLGTVASQSVDNSASKAVFNISGSITVAGGLLSTDSTKGGTSGILYGAVDFGASRALISGDILNITVTLTAASV